MTVAFDPILLEVLRHELVAISEEMNITMSQTTRSIVAKEGGDFSAGLLDPEGRVIAQAVPYGLGYFTAAMPHILRKYKGRFRPGDVIVSNDPYGGMSHLPDVAIVRPIFWQGALVGFTSVVQHHTDIGGRFPGGMGLACAEIFEEGLKLPAVRYYVDDRIDEAVQEIIAGNVRAPDDVLGDLEAGVAACRRGERGLLALIEKYGLERVADCGRRLLDFSEQAMRKVVASIPDGRYEQSDSFDDGLGIRVVLKVALVVEGDSMTVDFTGTGPQVGNALNVPPDMIGNFLNNNVFMALLGKEEAPINSGLFVPIRTVTEEGSVVRPRFPAAVGSRGQLIWRIADVVSAALADAIPERMPAASEGGVSMMVFTPNETKGGGKGRSVLTELYASGWGARPDKDGIDGVMPLAMAGFQTNSGEAIEQEMPMMLEGFGFVPDSGGAGAHRGSLAVYRSWRFLADGRVMLRTCRADSAPCGLCGGGDGARFRAVLIRDGVETDLPAQIMLDIAVKAGDVLMHVQPGGGGHGPASLRDPAQVREDLLDGKITPEHAQRLYGMVPAGAARF